MEFKVVTSAHKEDILRVFRHNKAYFKIVTGKAPGHQDLEDYLYDLPPGKALEDKLLYGVYEDQTCIALIDILKDYPKRDVCFLGLLMLDDRYHGKGYGKKIYKSVEGIVKAMGATTLRLGVVDGNPAINFWERMGFILIKTTRPMTFGGNSLRVHVMEKKLED